MTRQESEPSNGRSNIANTLTVRTPLCTPCIPEPVSLCRPDARAARFEPAQEHPGGEHSANTFTGTQTQIEQRLEPEFREDECVPLLPAALASDQVTLHRRLESARDERGHGGRESVEHDHTAGICGSKADSREDGDLGSSETTQSLPRCTAI